MMIFAVLLRNLLYNEFYRLFVPYCQDARFMCGENLPRTRNQQCRFTAEFRFYEELNDFLPKEKRKKALDYRFEGHPGIKDPIEVFGIPHTEVDLIVVNGRSVGFDYPLQNLDRVAVYPMFEGIDITPIVKLKGRPLRKTAFVVDVNLGKLSRLLRLLGFDTLYSNNYSDDEVADISVRENRIILTRDRRLLFARRITHGYWVRSVHAEEQVNEVIKRFDLYRQIKAFHRCLVCNGLLEPVDKEKIWSQIEPKTRRYYHRFYQCLHCKKVYWEGSHVEKMRKRFKAILKYDDV